ncbi:AMP-binding protein [Nocardiopsis ansamitocini]|uniref:AMP-binding protein n=1 Tax=Nocardiopsis ansamitocini TaxID=1670832 RepID=A0A9W6P875_9ACTN|nr:AMP-binding protein [Nocardiopsis ansamitocini]GLU48849.1 AMP-binding protein [Nocardiopsis ansamitocini]
MEPSYSRGDCEPPLLDQTIGHNLGRAVAAHPDRDALVDAASGRHWTYARFDGAVEEVALGLLAAGVAAGDRVGIWAPNCPEWVLVQYATARIGAVMVTVNPAYRAHELEYVLNQAGVRLLVSYRRHKTSDYRALVDQVRPACPELRDVVYVADPTWQRLIERGARLSPALLAEREAALRPDDPINIQYTSGTTGFPKGATLSHRNILNNGYFVGELLGYTENDRIVVVPPFYHCFGMVMGNLAATSHGACMIIAAPSFDPAAALRAVAAERATSLYGVPTMFIAELDLPDFASYDLSSLRTGIMAGSTCPVEVMRRVIGEMHMAEVAICYGMTETSPVSAQTRRDDDLERRTATVGRVLPHLEVAVVDPATGATVPRGVSGELRTRGYSVMLGYWNDPEATAAAIDAEGWMRTGDLAVMRTDGYLDIVGRIKDMIIRGGENVYPREIEEFLHTHPAISDVQVIGVPDAKYGEEVMACVILHEPETGLSAAELAAFCRDRLAHYKIPRHVRVVESFPLTVSGKVRKVAMREQAVAELSGPPS